MSNLMSKLEKFGGILVGAFGNEAMVGLLMGLLEDVTPLRCYEFIRDNKPLYPNVSDDDWEKYSAMVKDANLDDISVDRIRAELRKHRPDLLSVIINHPGGLVWFDGQVKIIKSKLGL